VAVFIASYTQIANEIALTTAKVQVNQVDGTLKVPTVPGESKFSGNVHALKKSSSKPMVTSDVGVFVPRPSFFRRWFDSTRVLTHKFCGRAPLKKGHRAVAEKPFLAFTLASDFSARRTCVY